MAFVTQGISSSKSGKEAGSTPSAGFTHPHKSVLEPFQISFAALIQTVPSLNSCISVVVPIPAF